MLPKSHIHNTLLPTPNQTTGHLAWPNRHINLTTALSYSFEIGPAHYSRHCECFSDDICVLDPGQPCDVAVK